jgi:hypothetical protein
MRDMTFADRASNAAKAAQQTKARAKVNAWSSYLADAHQAFVLMPNHPDAVVQRDIINCQKAIWSMRENLEAFERMLDADDTSDSAWGMFPE